MSMKKYNSKKPSKIPYPETTNMTIFTFRTRILKNFSDSLKIISGSFILNVFGFRNFDNFKKQIVLYRY